MFIVILCMIFASCDASTHWYVTEDGRLEGHFDSIYNLRHPSDVMMLLKQEERSIIVNEMQQKLVNRKQKNVGFIDEKDAELEQEFYANNKHCRNAGKALAEFDLYISTYLPLEYKGLSTSDFLHPIELIPSTMSPIPHCQVFILNFSMHTYDHLESIQFRRHISIIPEVQLKSQLTFIDDMETFGRQVSYALYKNSSSWVAHHLASLYWRIKGNAYESIECSRRGLHLTSWQYKDVLLVSLGNILHQIDRHTDAAILLEAALHVSQQNSITFFTLANIYAIQLNFNQSVINFDSALNIDKDFSEAFLRKSAVLCHWQFEKSLQTKERSLQDTLSSLQEYQETYEIMQGQNRKIESVQTNYNEKLKQRNFFDYYFTELQEVKSSCRREQINEFSKLNKEALAEYFISDQPIILPKEKIKKIPEELVISSSDICEADLIDECNTF